MDVSAIGAQLADAVDPLISGWVLSCIARFDQELAQTPQAAAAGVAARAQVMPPLRELLLSDIDRQRGTPLTVLRTAVAHPTAVLRAAGATEVPRDPYDAQAFPDDVFALNPVTWADVHPSLAEPGLRWSVAKAFEHRRRHRAG